MHAVLFTRTALRDLEGIRMFDLRAVSLLDAVCSCCEHGLRSGLEITATAGSGLSTVVRRPWVL